MVKINILEFFEQTVQDNPTKIGVIDGETAITFIDLKIRAEFFALQILKNVSCRSKPIAVFLPKCVACIVSDIAITYTGNIYMNIDVKAPKKRISNILDKIEPVLIITNSMYVGILTDLEIKCNIFNLDNYKLSERPFEKLPLNIFKEAIDTDPYCIINTSGSTGTPKGVVLNHKSFIDFTEWAIETLLIGDDEIVGSLSPVVFDIFSFELCLMMIKASTLVLIPEQHSAFPVTILEILQKTNVNFIFWVPTIMVNIANMDLLSKMKLAQLKTVWFAGEVFPTKQFNYWKRQLKGTKFVNLYGPIEITLDCTYYIVDRDFKDDEAIPIGYPCRNTSILILNDSGQQVNNNEIGELCVRGTSLAMGYYNDFIKTNVSFVQNPTNSNYPELIYRTGDLVSKNEVGEIFFRGRKDNQIKHLGYRIELGEIEHILINTLKIIDNGCVIYNLDKKEITLFYESKNNISIGEIRNNLLEILPKYMLPTQFYKKDELPRNTNGKIDRLLLTELLYDRDGSDCI
jgi:amino acid adenylation domain-containing protein